MEEKKEEKKSFKLFREKSLEAIESPEALNDYLRVTSPGVWLVLAAVAVLLVGVIFWSIFGRIKTTMRVAVVSENSQCTCLVPYEELFSVLSQDTITVDGKEYILHADQGTETITISEETNPYIRVAGRLALGEVAVVIPVEASLPEGVYTGSLVTESLQPMSLLLQ